MNFINDEDVVPVSCGGVFCTFPQLANVIDAGVGSRVDLENIDGFSRRDFLARSALVARSDRRSLSAVQPLGQNPCRRRLSHTPGPGKEVCVADPIHLDRILQGLDNRLLPDDIFKDLRAKLSRNDLVFAHEWEWTGPGDTASHWFTQYRCFLPDLAGFSGSNCAAPLSLQAVASLKRREWDSNPRWSYPHTRFPSVLLKPLGHLSGKYFWPSTLRLYHRFLMAHDDDRPPFALLEDLAKVVHELLIFDLAETRRVSRKLGQRLCQLGAGAIQVTVPEMVQANGSLDQSLVEKPGGTLGHPPEVFPGLVSLEVAAGVEKIYSLTQEIAHRLGLTKWLRDNAQTTKIDHEKTSNHT